MIVLFSDFGLEGPYIGQVKAVLHAQAPGVPVVDLFADAPQFNAKASAYLLAAYSAGFPPGSVFLAVVDPGVGGERPVVALRAGKHWFVGPGNGLFEIVARRATAAGAPCEWWYLPTVPETAAPTFHGRDVFAPIAAVLGAGPDDSPETAGCRPFDAVDIRHSDWPDDLAEIVYIDVFGNAMTGLRAASVPPDATLRAAGQTLQKAQTFSNVYPGHSFCYENSNGLLEIAVNQGRADRSLGLGVGDAVDVIRND